MKTVMIAFAALTLAACNAEVVDPAPAPEVDTNVVDTDERVCGADDEGACVER